MLRQSLASGFRVFFLLASAHAAGSVIVWALLLAGVLSAPAGGLPPVWWHAHEMVFGFSRAVVAGFLLTAVRNWTGLPTPTGGALGALASLWLVPRLLGWAGAAGIPLMAVLDLAFGMALLAAVGVPVVRARQGRQAIVLVWLGLFAAADAHFYTGAMGWSVLGLQRGVELGLYAVLGLLLTIAARVMPFFVRSALPGSRPFEVQPSFDRALSAALLAFWLAQAVAAPTTVVRVLAGVLAGGHGVRLVRWWRPGLGGRSLLWVLYGAYGWVVCGFALQAVGPWIGLGPVHALHAHAVGGVGAMAVGMMARVSLGHTGRDVRAPRPGLAMVFALVFVAAFLRVVGPWWAPASTFAWYMATAALWVVGLMALSVWGLPLWTRPRPDGQPG